MSSVAWIDNAVTGGDTWAGYPTERFLIADYIARNEIDNLVILSGDAHMVAMDDGTNSQYADVPDQPGPIVVHAAPLDRRGSYKGGPYSEGAYAPSQLPFVDKPGQFVELDFEDNGDELCFTATGYSADAEDGDLSELTAIGRCYPVSEEVQALTEAEVGPAIEDPPAADDTRGGATRGQGSSRRDPGRQSQEELILRDVLDVVLERLPRSWRRILGG